MSDIIANLLSRYGIFGVMAAAFLEPIVFPPPVEIILLPVMLAHPQKAVLYSILTVGISFLGGMIGYKVGKSAGRKLLLKMFGEDKVVSVEGLYKRYGVLAIISSAFTPIPYEAYTLSAGAFSMNFYKYLLATLAGRAIRYIPEGIAVQLFGHAISTKAIGDVSIFVCVLLIIAIAYIMFRKIANKSK